MNLEAFLMGFFWFLLGAVVTFMFWLIWPSLVEIVKDRWRETFRRSEKP